MSPPNQVSMVIDQVERAVKQLHGDGAVLNGSWTGQQAEFNSRGGHSSRRDEAEYGDNARDVLYDAFQSYYLTYLMKLAAAANQLPDQFSSLAGKGRDALWVYLGADSAAAKALTDALGF